MIDPLNRVQDLEPEQLETLLLHTRVEPHVLRSLGHEAFLDGSMPMYETAVQVCFDKGSQPETPDAISYATAYTFLSELPDREITIHR